MKTYTMTKRTILAMLLTAALLAFLPSCKKDPKAPVMTYNAGDEPSEPDNPPTPVEGTLTFTANGVTFKMLPVEGGTFTMGATSEQGSDAESDEKPTHSVTLSSYYMGETEVTQALWQAVMGSNPSYFSGSNLPVEQVSWNDCQTFITKLNQQCASQLNGKQFSLPTEAQWEFAARGGNQSHGYKYSGSNTLGNVAWYIENSGSTTHAVGTKTPNELGLYDMSGNVWEWCSDWYGSYGSSAQTDPTGPATGSNRVNRGGSWYYSAWRCRVSYRNDDYPDNSISSLGLRLALVTNENSNPLLPTVTTSQVSDITQVSAVSGGNVTDDGGSAVTERGICWSTSQNPTINNSHVANGTGTGSFTCQMTGLTAGTKYYVRAYAKNSQGTAYGSEVSFTTSQNISAPTVTTAQVSNITQTTALGGGNVTNDGGSAVTERGICWSTSQNPTINNSHVANGTGTGSFTCQMTGLTAGTKYYVRAYAKNSQGTAYGSEVSFTTQSSWENITYTFTVNGVSFQMLPVEGGTFTMGATAEQGSDAESNEYPTHSVTLSSFYMGETEVTQALWQAVMGSNPSYFTGDSQRPVECVSWNDCQTFITKLNQQCAGQLNGRQFCLPTEAEWEYAARGGKQSRGYKYSGRNTLGSVAWYNSGSTTHAVGTKQANELGLYDMSGNVWEWCSDWYGSYGSGAQTNPTGPATGSYRVCRGGGWDSDAGCCRVSNRDNYPPGDRGNLLGLRLSFR